MKACLLLGSNQGDRNSLLTQAQSQIEQTCGHVVKASRIYETPPWGFEADTPFLNQALLIDTPFPPQELLTHCLQIESSLGRLRTHDNNHPYTTRPIDIDLLFYENTICQTPHLTLPHPRLHLRRFALEPMAEVAPDWVHPLIGRTGREILLTLRDESPTQFCTI